MQFLTDGPSQECIHSIARSRLKAPARVLIANRTNRLVVLEPDFTGHRLEYVRYLALLSDSRQEPLLITSPETLESAEFRRELLDDGELLVGVDPSAPRGLGFWLHLKNLQYALHSVGPNGVVAIPNVDEYLLAMLAMRISFRKRTIRGLIMRPVDSTSSLKLKVKEFSIALLRIEGVHLFDLRSPFEEKRDQLTAILDPSGLEIVTSQRLASKDSLFMSNFRAWKGDDPRPVLAFLGVVTDRKGALETVEGLSPSSGFRVLVTGIPSDIDIVDQLERAAAKISETDLYLRFESLEAADLHALLREVDVVSLTYLNHNGSSGFLAHALAAERPILGYRNHVVNEVIKRTGTGVIVNSMDASDISVAVGEAIRLKPGSQDLHLLKQLAKTQWRRFAMATPEQGPCVTRATE